MGIVYYYSFIRLSSFLVNCKHTGVKKHEDSREWKPSWKPGLFGDLHYTICTVALFFRSVAWKRGADEPGSK